MYTIFLQNDSPLLLDRKKRKGEFKEHASVPSLDSDPNTPWIRSNQTLPSVWVLREDKPVKKPMHAHTSISTFLPFYGGLVRNWGSRRRVGWGDTGWAPQLLLAPLSGRCPGPTLPAHDRKYEHPHSKGTIATVAYITCKRTCVQTCENLLPGIIPIPIFTFLLGGWLFGFVSTLGQRTFGYTEPRMQTQQK